MHKCPPRQTEEGRWLGQDIETRLWRLSKNPPGLLCKGQAAPPSPWLAGIARTPVPTPGMDAQGSVVPEAAHGSDGAAPARPQSHLETSWAGYPGHQQPAPPRTDHPPACPGTKAGAGRQSKNAMMSGPERAEQLRHKPQHCKGRRTIVTWPKATTSKAASPVSHPFALCI